MVGGESRRYALQADEAADQQPGADEQHQRKGEFGDNEQAAQTVASQVQTAIGLPAAAAGFERRVQIHLDGAPHRREAEENAGRERKAEGEGQNRAVDSDIIEAGNIAGVHGAHDGKAEARDKKSGGAAEEASRMLSVSSWRASRCQPAPRAVRMATSFSRPAARASRRLATLAQAISRTSATEPSSTSRRGARRRPPAPAGR